MIQSVSGIADQRGVWAGSPGPRSAQVSRPDAKVGEEARGASASGGVSSSRASELTPEELRVVRQLEQTDRKVRAHEQAHLSVGADLVRGGATYGYAVGPDNKRYAVSGEVSIDASPGKTPVETIPKAQHIRATALAPVDPSAQDHRVAAAASQMEIDARMELAQQRSEEIRSGASENVSADDTASSYRHQQSDEYSSGRIGSFLNAFA